MIGDKGSMTGRRALDELLQKGSEKKDEQPPEDADSESDLCGIYSKIPQQGLVLELANGDHLGVFYGSICSAIVFIPTLGIHFQFVDAGDVVKEVIITGTDSPDSLKMFRTLHRHLTQGKRETLHVRKAIVESITVSELREEKPDED